MRFLSFFNVATSRSREGSPIPPTATMWSISSRHGAPATTRMGLIRASESAATNRNCRNAPARHYGTAVSRWKCSPQAMGSDPERLGGVAVARGEQGRAGGWIHPVVVPVQDAQTLGQSGEQRVVGRARSRTHLPPADPRGLAGTSRAAAHHGQEPRPQAHPENRHLRLQRGTRQRQLGRARGGRRGVLVRRCGLARHHQRGRSGGRRRNRVSRPCTARPHRQSRRLQRRPKGVRPLVGRVLDDQDACRLLPRQQRSPFGIAVRTTWFRRWRDRSCDGPTHGLPPPR